ncbi:PREDICTED: ubiquitin thioesterase OTU1-like isoform X1 [Amphimedon queenslandica]|uniref:Ubiquitin thioesterase OTU n=1 Tax=Amphimedon queenslandica TaxID=400682 RepID=A0AAN0JAK1_AMPQE|nr:PREDICTED: ubiquitin thioesterase OTU1-like isoform X1 [Amphimedon queenslandica]|eukprot:XP_019854085.1 PREDICTED: ubiquitin thioesterase OTU1-like isoform X1 [Amphimedon queenslandica]
MVSLVLNFCMFDDLFKVVRLQCKTGRFILSNIKSSTTLKDLQAAIKDKTDVPPEQQKILHSYPPKEIESYDSKLTMADIGIKDGDTVTLQELQQPRGHRPKKQRQPVAQLEADKDVLITGESKVISNDTPSGPQSSSSSSSVSIAIGELKRKVVPADNSCLFASVNILVNGNTPSYELREIVSSVIASQPHKYTDAMLGRPRDEYVQWILKDVSWGGGIELLIFSNFYEIELVVVDIQTLRLDRFGKGYSSKGFLIYDGIHYDPLVLLSPNGTILQRLFSQSNESITESALAIARDCNQARQFTDLSNFSLRCLVCNELLKGSSDAQEHATKTGHTNFSEV